MDYSTISPRSSGRTYVSSVPIEMRDAARNVDPNLGRCLLTLQTTNPIIHTCHLVPRSLSLKLVSHFYLSLVSDCPTFVFMPLIQHEFLEWWWGLPWRTLNVDVPGNLIFLRSDLHGLFDSNYWMLLPELTIVDQICNTYENLRENAPQSIYQTYTPGVQKFTYHLVPIKPMDVLIGRLNNTSADTNTYSIHVYPFTTIGPLESHAHPHFVLFNAGEKIDPSNDHKLNLLKDSMHLHSFEEAKHYAERIRCLYELWISRPDSMGFKVWKQGSSSGRASNRGGPSGQNRKSTEPSTPPPATSSHRGSSRSGNFAGGPDPESHGGHRVALLPYPHILVDLEAKNFIAERGDILSLLEWRTRVNEVTNNGGWEPNVWNDNQLGTYPKELARSPKDKWHPTWMRHGSPDGHKQPPDTSKFSSNDWCLKDCRVRLPDPVDDDDYDIFC